MSLSQSYTKTEDSASAQPADPLCADSTFTEDHFQILALRLVVDLIERRLLAIDLTDNIEGPELLFDAMRNIASAMRQTTTTAA